MSRNLGQHIATRLVELGVDTFFTVPGDYNLVLLDQLISDKRLKMINCCNELNAGYAADGYARVKGVACVVVTFTVGGLSVINAIAGALSENLAVIVITGGPNSNDYGTNRILHHTTGFADFHQEARCFKEVTCAQTEIFNLDDARLEVDHTIASAVRESKPVYLSICCNLAHIPHPSFSTSPVPYAIAYKQSNADSLTAAVDAAAEFLNKAVRPVIVNGVRIRVSKAHQALVELADACGYPVAAMPNAKGMFPEDHPRYLGTYWSVVSSPYVAETVESSDAYLVVGGAFNDYSSAGYTMLIKKAKMVDVQPHHVVIGGHQTFSCVIMKDFLKGLAGKLKQNATAWEQFDRMYVGLAEPPQSAPGSPLRTKSLFKHVQRMLTEDSAVLAETGDSWFNCQKLKLPKGCLYEFQMQYGSIGWSVGALLGYQAALHGKKRVLAFIGDGSFQVTMQDIASLMRWKFAPILFLINNQGYTIEVEIHDGPYNYIKSMDYVALVKAIDNGDGNSLALRVDTEEELEDAIEQAHKHTDGLVFIECTIHRDDCSRELLEWGSRVSEANMRPPNPQ
ncbi:hypothetical protein WJX73_005930 [Symbiochloris irregularis]|uniref:pyruvate decarboxylase n=1 Tax=Symbiochloris irregularis TaxID=706552 RepID=A0AAW1P8M3_9CHLO